MTSKAGLKADKKYSPLKISLAIVGACTVAVAACAALLYGRAVHAIAPSEKQLWNSVFGHTPAHLTDMLFFREKYYSELDNFGFFLAEKEKEIKSFPNLPNIKDYVFYKKIPVKDKKGNVIDESIGWEFEENIQGLDITASYSEKTDNKKLILHSVIIMEAELPEGTEYGMQLFISFTPERGYKIANIYTPNDASAINIMRKSPSILQLVKDFCKNPNPNNAFLQAELRAAEKLSPQLNGPQ